MLVIPSQKIRPRWMTRGFSSVVGAAMFVAPLLVLVILWAIVVPLFQINPRVFPSLGAVGTAAMDSIRDGTLIKQ